MQLLGIDGTSTQCAGTLSGLCIWHPSLNRLTSVNRGSNRIALKSIQTRASLGTVIQKIKTLPNPIFPGGQDNAEASLRGQIDSLVSDLERESPINAPLALEARPLLSGRWRLIYASKGTVVTKSAVGSLLRILNSIPYVGLEEVEQDLVDADGKLETRNAAVFGLGPLGAWRICITGRWDVKGENLAKVSFDEYSMEFLGVFGCRFDSFEFFGRKISSPKLTFPTKSALADFSTTYLDSEGAVRVSRGASGNIFFFQKV